MPQFSLSHLDGVPCIGSEVSMRTNQALRVLFTGHVLLWTLVSGCSASGAANAGSGGTLSSGNTGGATAIGTSSGAAANGGSGNTGNTVSTGGNSPGAGGAVAVGGAVGAGGNVNVTGGMPATGGAPATGGYTCTPGTQLGTTNSTNYFVAQYSPLQPFYIFNNGWSTSSTTLTTAGTQESVSVYDTCTPGTISWETDYNWSGANNTVKAYPSAILGWQSTKGWLVSQTMLPKTISSIASAQCSWTYTVTGGASQDVAFDIWVHNTTCSTSAITSSTAPSDEIMIWLYSSGGVQPAGSTKQSNLSISGATWTLWEGPVSSWTVHSFVRSGNATSVQNLDILAFLKQANLSTSLSSRCLSSIEAGTEIFQGSGTVKTNSYTCTVQ